MLNVTDRSGRYVQLEALEEELIYGESSKDIGDCESILRDFGKHKNDWNLFAREFSSPLEVDRPLFFDKTYVVVEGSVSFYML
jgi:hypothetical protein